MNSRQKKQKMRYIIKQNKDILRHPEWWGDEKDEFYSPYVNVMARLGIYPWTWSFSKDKNRFEGAFCSFVYTYMTNGDKLKNGIADITISNDVNEDIEGYSSKIEKDGIYLLLKKGSLGNNLEFLVICNHLDSDFVYKMMTIIADFMMVYYHAKLLITGSMNINRSKSFCNFNVLIAILRSYWTYAKGGCTHMYHLKKRSDAEAFDLDDMFESFELSEDELKQQKDEYQEMLSLVLAHCGSTTCARILLNFNDG